MAVKKLLEVAAAEIGVAVTGQNNVKYNTWYYGRTINASGYAWCVVFVFWAMVQAKLGELFYNGYQEGKTPVSYSTASCSALYSYHKAKGQAVSGNYQPGDILFFNFSGGTSPVHVGICESWDGSIATTIEGNTSAAGSQAAGGHVMRKSRAKKYIVAAFRPAYPTETEETTEMEEEEEVTQEQFNTMFDTCLATKATLAADEWAEPELSGAVGNGITDGTRPQSFGTRQENAIMVQRSHESIMAVLNAILERLDKLEALVNGK